jgi:hypothetical protein
MPMLEPIIPVTISCGLVLLFLAALVHKVRDWRRFRETLANYESMPRVLVPAVAVMVVAAEAAVVVGGITASTRSAAAVLASALLLIYGAAMATNLLRGRRLIDCGCAGFGQRQSLDWWMVRRNVLLAAVALVAVWPVSDRALALPDLFVVVCATVSAAGLYLAHATLAGNRRYR